MKRLLLTMGCALVCVAGESVDYGWCVLTTTTTNLPVKILEGISTNVVHGSNERGCFFAPSHPMIPVFHKVKHADFAACERYEPPTEKWVITNVVKTTEIRFQLKGKPMLVRDEVVLSSVTNRYVLSGWVKQ